MIEDDISDLERRCEKLTSMISGLCEKLKIDCPYDGHDNKSEWSYELGCSVYRCTWCSHVTVPEYSAKKPKKK